ncbi:MFS transporter [Streptomyces rochei]|uniref:MFS transporter n=1 Tax=Streptomyces vinaceusdrappus TaxID=67376 RepID=A0ABY6C4H9_9ACTN|nr:MULTISPECIES: MFS transporter [Streptomyces]RSS23542.1 MFS transporter [Streptomyces sp. WAC08452]UXI82824.1 MFS transporter [Streptomyces vinaceusdrappus]
MHDSIGHHTKSSGHRAWWVATAAGVAIVVAGAFSTMPGILQDPLRQEFHWSRGSIGLAASVNMILYGLTAPYAAALMDRFGIRRVVVAALGTVAAGAVLTTVMSAAWQFTLFWGFLVGLGTGSLSMTLGTTVTNRWFTTRRGLVTGILSSGSVLGQMVFLPALSWTIARYDWRPALLSLALAALAVTPLVYLVLRDHPADLGRRPYGSTTFVPRPAPVPGAARRTLTVLSSAARTVPFWLLASAFAICGASTNGIMWTHFAPAAHDHGMPVTTASTLLAFIGIFNVVGTVASGWLTDRMDARRLLAVYFLLRGLLMLSLPLIMTATVSPPMLAFVVAFGLLDLATVPPVIALCRTFYGADSAIVFGWTNAAHQIGAASASFLGGVARDTFGSYDFVWLALAAACATAALLSLVIRLPHTSSASDEQQTYESSAVSK